MSASLPEMHKHEAQPPLLQEPGLWPWQLMGLLCHFQWTEERTPWPTFQETCCQLQATEREEEEEGKKSFDSGNYDLLTSFFSFLIICLTVDMTLITKGCGTRPSTSFGWKEWRWSSWAQYWLCPVPSMLSQPFFQGSKFPPQGHSEAKWTAGFPVLTKSFPAKAKTSKKWWSHLFYHSIYHSTTFYRAPIMSLCYKMIMFHLS